MSKPKGKFSFYAFIMTIFEFFCMVFPACAASGFKVCPGGWTRLGGQCYGYSDTAKDWSSARAACRAQGADLASVPDRNVDLLLYSLVGAAAGTAG